MHGFSSLLAPARRYAKTVQKSNTGAPYSKKAAQRASPAPIGFLSKRAYSLASFWTPS